ncbi:MAG: transcriptional regulator with XRE-family HTH domain [Lysobacterales bacterium]|jgi:transcriptional regulator with XRE-family HTH domain
MISFKLMSSQDIAVEMAVRVRGRRLAQNLSLEGLARRSGVALGTLKKFEHTGQIALVSFIRLVLSLKDEAALENLLLEQPFETLDEILQSEKKPKRGRIK